MSDKKVFTAEEKIQRAYDILQIKNVMGRHAYFHAWGKHPEEYEEIWSKKCDDISWGNSMGFQMGREVFYANYVAPHVGKAQGKGVMFMHTLTTALVEFAEDGETAQAMWYTPGYGTGSPGGGKATANWMYERYAIDFIKEDGEWKIWHFFVGTDFAFDAGSNYTGRIAMGGPPPEEKEGPPEEKEPEKGILRIRDLASTKFGWPAYPPIPKPYKTFSETVSYGPESFLK